MKRKNYNLNPKNKILSHIFYLVSSRRGFTLIELLVTISIIAVLTTLLTANFIGARERGRDGQRKSNLYQIQSALELYRSDNGIYPLSGPPSGQLSACNIEFSSAGNSYMKKVPCDPGTSAPFQYTSTDGRSYTLVACLENDQDSERDSSKHASCAKASFTLTNP